VTSSKRVSFVQEYLVYNKDNLAQCVFLKRVLTGHFVCNPANLCIALE
jgi:hypothetical protein